MPRHPDIEIYVKNASVESIRSWLEQCFGELPPFKKRGDSQHAKVQGIPIVIVERAAGKEFTSIWFDSAATPWETDLDCAKEASKMLSCQVRCIGSGWEEQQDPDEWWKVDGDEVTAILWKG